MICFVRQIWLKRLVRKRLQEHQRVDEDGGDDSTTNNNDLNFDNDDEQDNGEDDGEEFSAQTQLLAGQRQRRSYATIQRNNIVTTSATSLTSRSDAHAMHAMTKARKMWLLCFTLVRNPKLVADRTHKLVLSDDAEVKEEEEEEEGKVGQGAKADQKKKQNVDKRKKKENKDNGDDDDDDDDDLMELA